jgi:hypothetical protein
MGLTALNSDLMGIYPLCQLLWLSDVCDLFICTLLLVLKTSPLNAGCPAAKPLHLSVSSHGFFYCFFPCSSSFMTFFWPAVPVPILVSLLGVFLNPSLWFSLHSFLKHVHAIAVCFCYFVSKEFIFKFSLFFYFFYTSCSLSFGFSLQYVLYILLCTPYDWPSKLIVDFESVCKKQSRSDIRYCDDI